MKKVAIVAAHFPPSNLAGVHRARLWAQHLPEFGWEPVIVTTHWKYYEELLDWDLHSIVDSGLRVIRTRAVPVRPVRVIGDIGIRAFPWHLGALRRLVVAREVDFIHITIPSNYSALLGPILEREFGIPYGIDYIDPWVHSYPGTEAPLSKAWTSYHLAKRLEPKVLARTSLVTGVAEGYYSPALERNPAASKRAVTRAMPYGASEKDFEAVKNIGRRPYLFDPVDGKFHIVYAGAMLPKAFVVLERLLQGLRVLMDRQPEVAARLRLHFIGTGKTPTDARGFNVTPMAERLNVSQAVTEYPARIGYVDVLTHLVAANAVLIVGSTEPHYTPSKVFQAIQSCNPVLALLHPGSAAIRVLVRAGSTLVLAVSDDELPTPEVVADSFVRLVRLPDREWSFARDVLEPYSARVSASALADALDDAYSRARSRGRS